MTVVQLGMKEFTVRDVSNDIYYSFVLESLDYNCAF